MSTKNQSGPREQLVRSMVINRLRVLVACEFTGTVRDAFTHLGHYAISCDIEPSEKPGWHYQGNVLDILHSYWWDLVIAFPPCTFLCGSGLHWNNRGRGWQRTEEALSLVDQFLFHRAPYVAIENPVGIISTRRRESDQRIQPYNFGADASKKTCLWLKNLPPLSLGIYVSPRVIEWPLGSGRMVSRWANQCDSGQNKLGGGSGQDRSRTYPGVADAMASQWSNFILSQLRG